MNPAYFNMKILIDGEEVCVTRNYVDILYTLPSSPSGSYSFRWYYDTSSYNMSAYAVILDLTSIPEDSKGSFNQGNNNKTPALTEAERQRQKEEADRKQFWDNLNECYANGHAFFLVDNQQYFAASLGNQLKIYKNGAQVSSITAQELFSDAGENTQIYVTGKGYHTADGVSYQTVKYEIRDGETVVFSGEYTLSV